jgi:hypothetical protein
VLGRVTAQLFWGCGSVYAKRAPHPAQPLLASGMEMICAGVALALCLAGAASGELGRISAASLLSTPGLALGYLIVSQISPAKCDSPVASLRGR